MTRPSYYDEIKSPPPKAGGITDAPAGSEDAEITDGLRTFRLTGITNATGMLQAEVVRVTPDGRSAGWLPGPRVWLYPADVFAMTDVR